MLLEFQCKNFKSIGERITFSMLSANENDNSTDFFSISDNKGVLKKSAIYGPNGSGKSNFLSAIGYVKQIVSLSHLYKPESRIVCPIHKLFEDTQSEFVIHFSSRNNIRYSYGFSVFKGFIEEEFLNYFPNGRIAKIFSRKGNYLEYGEKFASTLKKVSEQFLSLNRLMLSCAGMYSNIEEIINAFVFFDQDLVIYPAFDEQSNQWKLYSAKQAMENEMLRDRFVGFLKGIGNNGLVGVKSTVKESRIDENLFKKMLNEDFIKQLNNTKNYDINVLFDYDKYKLNIMEESLGNQKLFELFFPLVDILSNGKVLLCDEFERSLHPLVVQEIISLFKKNSKGAQLIFTTHDVSILHPDIFRRDEIWFTEIRGDKRETDIYSLADLQGVRKEELFGKNYIKGKYYAIPLISTENIEQIIFGGKA